MTFASLVVIISSALTGLANPPSPQVPRVLLDAPIAMRIAANNVAHWRALGASGFLLHGVYDDLDAAPQGGLQDVGVTAPESSLLKEIRLSVAELADAGLDQNFLRVDLGPDRAWFANRDTARAGLAFFEAAGVFCARSGLRGLALDLRADSPMYRYNWSGHGAPRSSTQLSALAQEFGRRGLRGFIRAMPDADFIFIVDDLERAGPLLFSLLAGLVESVGAADSIRLDLMLTIPGDAVDFRARERYLEGVEDLLCGSMGEKARTIWQRQGGYVPVLRPLEVKERAVVPAVDLAKHRDDIAVAKLLASDYIAVRSDYGVWWKLSAKQAASYGKLRQRGAAKAVATPKPIENASVWSFTSPFDGMQRVGALRERKDAPYVFQDELRSAVLFWKAPEGAIAVDQGVAAALSTSLATGKEQTLTAGPEGVHLAEADAPALLRGLPINEWAAPAALWCAFDAAPSAGADRVPVRLGLRNVYPGDLSGVLKVETPAALSLGTADVPIFLKPGNSVVFEKALQGSFALGETETLKVSLISPLSRGVSRQFNTRAHLRGVWKQQRDGTVSTAPLVLQDAAGTVIVTVSESGDIAAYGADGTLIWQRRYPAPVVMSAWAGRGTGGQPLVALGDGAGVVRVLQARGAAVWEAHLASPIDEVIFADVFALGSDALLVQTREDVLACFNAEGLAEWRYAPDATLRVGTPAQVRKLSPNVQSAEERLFVSVGGASPRLVRLNAHGIPMWSRDLSGEAALSPVVLAEAGALAARVLVPLADGRMSVFSMGIGAPMESEIPKLSGTWGVFEPLAQATDSDSPALLAGCGQELVALDANLKSLWRATTVRPRAVVQVEDGWLSLGGGQLSALAENGALRWKDTPPIGVRALAPRTLPRTGSTATSFFVGGADGFVHRLEMPPSK